MFLLGPRICLLSAQSLRTHKRRGKVSIDWIFNQVRRFGETMLTFLVTEDA